MRGNIISTYGNECVDIKEGSTENLIEENTCSDQFDEESGCYDVRGDDNIIRCYNLYTNRNNEILCSPGIMVWWGDESIIVGFHVTFFFYGSTKNIQDYHFFLARAFPFRYNKATNCLGAGVRLGGWDVDGYAHGQGNNVRIIRYWVYSIHFSECLLVSFGYSFYLRKYDLLFLFQGRSLGTQLYLIP